MVTLLKTGCLIKQGDTKNKVIAEIKMLQKSWWLQKPDGKQGDHGNQGSAEIAMVTENCTKTRWAKKTRRPRKPRSIIVTENLMKTRWPKNTKRPRKPSCWRNHNSHRKPDKNKVTKENRVITESEIPQNSCHRKSSGHSKQI